LTLLQLHGEQKLLVSFAIGHFGDINLDAGLFRECRNERRAGDQIEIDICPGRRAVGHRDDGSRKQFSLKSHWVLLLMAAGSAGASIYMGKA
jgi:hypothetical protein